MREEREKHGVTCSRVEFWHSRVKELEARLQMYEGKQGGENPKGGASDDACKDLGAHGRPGRPGLMEVYRTIAMVCGGTLAGEVHLDAANLWSSNSVQCIMCPS